MFIKNTLYFLGFTFTNFTSFIFIVFLADIDKNVKNENLNLKAKIHFKKHSWLSTLVRI